MKCVTCHRTSSSGFCLERCRVIYTYTNRLVPCIIKDCPNQPKGLKPLCADHLSTHCLNCGTEKKDQTTFCSVECSKLHPPRRQCMCMHVTEHGDIIPCSNTPDALPLKYPRCKTRKKGKNYHKLCAECANGVHRNWIEDKLCDVSRQECGMALKIVTLMCDAIDEMTKSLPIPCVQNSKEYQIWYSQAIERSELQIRLNRARGCGIIFHHISDKIRLLVIGEQTANGIRYGFVGGKHDVRMGTVYRRESPNNPQNRVARLELPYIAAVREFIEECGGKFKWIYLQREKVYLGVYDKPGEDSTEVVFGFVVNDLAYEEMVKVQNHDRTVYKGWWTLDEIYNHKDFRPGDLNGLDDMLSKIQADV